jgi:peptide/nickel transport system substrate-binding protein
MIPRTLTVTVGLLLVAAAGSACAPSAPENESSAQTLTVATTTDVVSFNPHIGASRTDAWITDLMYPRLLDIGADGDKTPSLAREWGYTSPTSGFYEIRDDMKWSDGKPVTASDVADTINSVKEDQPAGITYGLTLNVAKATAVSDTRVEVSLSRPAATAISEIGFWMPVVPEHIWSKVDYAKFANDSDWVSAGPYRLVKVAEGQSYTFERVTPYPFAPNNTPTAKELVFRVYPDVNTELLALKNGDVDVVANALPPAQVEPLQATDGVEVQRVPGLGYTHIQYNLDRKPLNDLLVRQALAHAVDYERIRDVVLQGQGVTTESNPIPPVLEQYKDPTASEYAFDPQQSRELLTQAGYQADSDGNFPLSFTMIYSLQDSVMAQWAKMVRDDAEKAGIAINLKGLDRNAYLAASDAGEYDIYAGNFAIMDDPPTNMTLTYLPDGVINYSHVDDPALTKLVTQAQATGDRQTQQRLVLDAAEIVRDKIYDNILHTQNLYFAHSDGWTNFVVQPSELLSIVNPKSLAQAKPVG